MLWLAAALAAPTAFLSGLLFTLLAARLNRSIASPTRAAAWLTLANTTGAMCGPAIAALVLLPAFGMERAIFGVAATYLGAAAHLGESERRGLRDPAVRALQVYAMCLAGGVTAARQLAAGASTSTDDEKYW
jgi:hypothetical protein